jgi:Fe-S oxidoreductase
MPSDFAAALQTRAQDVLDGCTACGACFEICPMTGPAGLDDHDAGAVTRGVLDLLRGEPGNAAAAQWASACSGSGTCIPKCPHGVNPRFMLTLARVAVNRREETPAREAKGRAGFTKMGRGVRVLSHIQLSAEALERVHPRAIPEGRPDVVFYTGCNVLKTPHIVLLCLDILDALGVSYRVMGGPGNCCGVIQFRAADLETSGRIAYRTTDRFAETGAETVLSWCPSCQVQLGENVLPGRERRYEFEGFVAFLADNIERLRPLLKHRVEKRVGLHEHPGIAGVREAAERVLRAVPGLEFVELQQPSVGYMCNTLPAAYKRELHTSLLQAAAQARVDALAGIYHACHRDLCTHEAEWPFEVVNFLELVGESMGIRYEDHFKRLKKMQDAESVLADVMDLVRTHGLDVDEVRKIIANEMLAEQTLPLGAARVGE